MNSNKQFQQNYVSYHSQSFVNGQSVHEENLTEENIHDSAAKIKDQGNLAWNLTKHNKKGKKVQKKLKATRKNGRRWKVGKSNLTRNQLLKRIRNSR